MVFAVQKLVGEKMELEKHIDNLKTVEDQTNNEEISIMIQVANADLEDLKEAIAILEESYRNEI